ncbi:MAG: hypothetical protein IKO44_04895 [Ruminococcus sp.]|nr:hypothetical protein [Ruminococcus sp.]MBR4622859.1 hypothetical protein [Ruminococcus sp.]
MDGFFDLDKIRETRFEERKWAAFFAGFALTYLIARWLRKDALDKADLLGGKATVEGFKSINIATLAFSLVALAVFIFLVIKTWKGRESSIFQLVFTIAAGLIVLYGIFVPASAVIKISSELKHPTEVTVSSYVTCMQDGKCLLVFDEEGSSDSIVLVIPKEKYSELKDGEPTPSNKTYLSRSWRLIDGSEYGGYSDAALYSSEIDVTYYEYSVIYESVGFSK